MCHNDCDGFERLAVCASGFHYMCIHIYIYIYIYICDFITLSGVYVRASISSRLSSAVYLLVSLCAIVRCRLCQSLPILSLVVHLCPSWSVFVVVVRLRLCRVLIFCFPFLVICPRVTQCPSVPHPGCCVNTLLSSTPKEKVRANTEQKGGDAVEPT